MWGCPYKDCPYRSNDGDDVDEHVLTAHISESMRQAYERMDG
jgi:hypothetical protein